MPTRGRHHLAPKAVTLFLNQTYEPRELLIADDEDSPSFPDADWLNQFPDVRYFRMPKRLTIGSKRNFLVDRSYGPIIAHWDDDDWYAPTRIEEQVKVLEADTEGKTVTAVGIEIEECFCELAALRLSQGGFDFANIPSPQQLPLTTGFHKSDDVISHSIRQRRSLRSLQH
jgi:glycosyltransferase involved in cell wall biosynthesis